MLTDNPYYCDDCNAWLTLNESLEHAGIGHQIHEASTPTKIIAKDRRHHQDNPPSYGEAA